MTPVLPMRPNVGLKPTQPLYAPGRRTEPTVCVPRATGTMRDATATPEPLLEPAGVCSAFHGFFAAGRMAARKLRRGRLAEHDRAGLAKLGDAVSIGVGHAASKYVRASLRQDACRIR